MAAGAYLWPFPILHHLSHSSSRTANRTMTVTRSRSRTHIIIRCALPPMCVYHGQNRSPALRCRHHTLAVWNPLFRHIIRSIDVVFGEITHLVFHRAKPAPDVVRHILHNKRTIVGISDDRIVTIISRDNHETITTIKNIQILKQLRRYYICDGTLWEQHTRDGSGFFFVNFLRKHGRRESKH